MIHISETHIDSIEFGTSDLGLASALACCGYSVLRMEQAGENRIRFVFMGKAIPSIANNYWMGNLPLDAKKFFENIKSVKNLLHNCK